MRRRCAPVTVRPRRIKILNSAVTTPSACPRSKFRRCASLKKFTDPGCISITFRAALLKFAWISSEYSSRCSSGSRAIALTAATPIAAAVVTSRRPCAITDSTAS